MTLSAPVETLGPTSTGEILAHAGGKLFEIVGGAAVERRLYVSAGDPASMGGVHAIVPRRAGGAWIAADYGLFMLDGLYVARSPLAPPAEAQTRSRTMYSVVDVAPGALGGLWIAAEAGLFRHQADTFDELHLAEHASSTPARSIAVDLSSSTVVVGLADAPALLRLENDTLVSERLPSELAAPTAFAGLPGVLLGAGEHGLVRWNGEGGVPAWTRFVLAEDEASSVVVRAVTIDPVSHVAWLRTSDQIIKLDGEMLAAFAAPALPDGAPASLAVDAYGDLWTNDGADAVRFRVGLRDLDVTFSADVAPWLAAHCTTCHAGFAELTTFSDRADASLARVRAGDMPRCEGGAPCAERPLDEAELAVLEAWIRGGRRP